MAINKYSCAYCIANIDWTVLAMAEKEKIRTLIVESQKLKVESQR
jgi:hypothetical protein